jgi:hypothetical protein
MPSNEAEDSIYRAAKEGLRRWLGRARDVVMTPWKQFKAQPNPGAIASTVPLWQAQVDRILAALTPALKEGWAAAHLPGDYDPTDPYIQANLALTYNLLVRVPDDVHAKVVKEILEGTNAGESTGQIAQRIDNVLTYTGSENWDGRARLISRTEGARHFNSSQLAHALLQEKNGAVGMTKQWDTVMDGKERLAHQVANNQVQPINQPFIVDGEQLMFPLDPVGSPENVISCRCSMNFDRVREAL